MIESMGSLILVSLLVAGPLAVRAWSDRREARALSLRADLHAAMARALGGESLVALWVRSPALWREGQVVLSAPAGSESLTRAAWKAIAGRVPEGYDLVVRSTEPAWPRATQEVLAWGQVA